VSALW